jgi:hypothetical protein
VYIRVDDQEVTCVMLVTDIQPKRIILGVLRHKASKISGIVTDQSAISCRYSLPKVQSLSLPSSHVHPSSGSFWDSRARCCSSEGYERQGQRKGGGGEAAFTIYRFCSRSLFWVSSVFSNFKLIGADVVVGRSLSSVTRLILSR